MKSIKKITVLAIAAAAMASCAAGEAHVSSLGALPFSSSSLAASSFAEAPYSSEPSSALASSPQPFSAAGHTEENADDISEETENGENAFVNTQLLLLADGQIYELEALYGENYFIHEVGLMTGALEYYNPYICIYFYPSSYFNASGLPQNETEQNPFAREDLPITGIYLQAELDFEQGTIINQNSLKQLFNTEEQITYTLLAKQLGQSPALLHNAEGGAVKITEYQISEWAPLGGGTYNADYIIDGHNISVYYIENSGEYIADAAEIHGSFEF